MKPQQKSEDNIVLLLCVQMGIMYSDMETRKV